jgi:hypothetical protein
VLAKEVKKDKAATKPRKNSNKLACVEAKWYKPEISTGSGFRQDCRKKEKIAADSLKRKSKGGV